MSDDVERYIAARRLELELFVAEGSERGTLVNDLANDFHRVFTQHPDRRLIEEATELGRQALHSADVDDSNRVGRLLNLAEHLRALSASNGSTTAAREAEGLFLEALDGMSATDSRRLSALEARASMLIERGDSEALDEALLCKKATLEIAATPAETQFRLLELSEMLALVFERSNDRNLLSEATSVAERAVSIADQPLESQANALDILSQRRHESYRLNGGGVRAVNEIIDLNSRAIELAEGTRDLTASLYSNRSIFLGDLYSETGNTAVLEDAVACAAKSVDVGSDLGTVPAAHLANYALRLGVLAHAKGERGHLDEAVRVATRAVAESAADSGDWAQSVYVLAKQQYALFGVTGDAGYLDDAISNSQRVVDHPDAHASMLAIRLHDHATYLRRSFDVRGRIADLSAAVAAAQRAIDLTPITATGRARHANNLANHRIALYVATGDTVCLDGVTELLSQIEAAGPADRVLVARTLARLSRATNDPAEAARVLEAAKLHFAEVAEEFADQPMRLRDLAGDVEGLVSDLATCYVLSSDQANALELLEEPRTWLHHPVTAASPGQSDDVMVVWIATSEWETVVLSNRLTDPVIVGLTRQVLLDRLNRFFGAPRGRERLVAADALVETVTDLLRGVVPEDEMLIVPTGPCSLLPFGAALTVAGEHLVEKSAVTVAPTVGISVAARRPRPRGSQIGVFHPGEPALDLVEDRTRFHEAFPSALIMDSPNAADVLSEFGADSQIAHFSCHGFYNAGYPTRSAIVLCDDLTMGAVLDSRATSWLVNLSACETGIPDLTRSEQMISFPTAFLLGGSAHVIGTLWSIGNAHATEYNRALYAHLAQGLSVARAHQLAVSALRLRLEQASNRERDVGAQAGEVIDLAHPYYWSAFQHYGSYAESVERT